MNKEFKEILTGFKRTLGLMQKPEKVLLLVSSLIMLITGTLTNLPAVILGRIVDGPVSSTTINFREIIPYVLLIVIIILVREALTVLRKYFVENIATQTEKKQTLNAVEHLLKTDIATITSQQIGSLHGKVFRSIEGLIKIIKLGFLDFFPVAFSALAALVIALTQKPLLATLMALVIPAGLFIIIKQISSQKGIRISLLRSKEKVDGAVVEMLGGIETVRTLNTTDYEVEKIEAIAEEIRKKEIKHHISMAFFDAGKYLNEGFFYVLVVCIAIVFSANGIISKGDILVYSILFLSITSPLREIHRILDEAHESSIRVNDLHELLEQPLDISYKASSAVDQVTIVPDNTIINISHLYFSYNQSSPNILNDVTFNIQRGEKIGIVGSSGCGKSTLIKILLRLIHNYSGKAEIDGEDLQNITRAQIARKIAYIPQKTYIFSGTIKENIIYGHNRRGIADSEILEAAAIANVADEIEKSLGGLQGRVSENGNNLSGGQKQRLALARLALGSPDIIIFDEATSALDNTNESTIQQHIENIFKDKTTITIAHRLTTLKNCDRILVLNKGSIVQEGTYHDLSKREGLFHDFLTQKETPAN